jgi:diaminopimelate epimerase
LGDGVEMTLYNADGSTAEMSGNGIRCLAAAVRRETNGQWQELAVKTQAGRRTVYFTSPEATEASVAMGTVSAVGQLPESLAVINVGNPHVVVLDQPEWTTSEREVLARKFSELAGGANVEFISYLSDGHIRLVVYERGVGWTLACGTGSCASAYVARTLGWTQDETRVDNPGGTLIVRFDGDEATLQGPVSFVADETWTFD